MKSESIILSKGQTALFQPLFDEIDELNAAGKTGAIFAQVFNTTEGDSVVQAWLIENETALKIQGIIDPDLVGKKSPVGKEFFSWLADDAEFAI